MGLYSTMKEGASVICESARCGVEDVSGQNSEAVISGADGIHKQGYISACEPYLIRAIGYVTL